MPVSESEPYRGANSNMHSVEAYLAAGDVTGDPVWPSRAASIADRLINDHARAHAWRIPEHYDENWQPHRRSSPEPRSMILAGTWMRSTGRPGSPRRARSRAAAARPIS